MSGMCGTELRHQHSALLHKNDFGMQFTPGDCFALSGLDRGSAFSTQGVALGWSVAAPAGRRMSGAGCDSDNFAIQDHSPAICTCRWPEHSVTGDHQLAKALVALEGRISITDFFDHLRVYYPTVETVFRLKGVTACR